MLKNLNILAESKGYTKQGAPQPRARIPLKRSMTAAALPRGKGARQSAADKPPTVPQRDRMKASKAGGKAASSKAGKKVVRLRAPGEEEKEVQEVADGAYARLEGLDEEDEDDVRDELSLGSSRHAPPRHSPVLLASAESLGALSRSRSEATYSSSMAVFTPAGQDSRRRAFFPSASASASSAARPSVGSTPVLVEETMDDGSVRVMIAHDTLAAVQHMAQQAEQQRHTDEANSANRDSAASAQQKRDEEEPALDPISSFAAKLLDHSFGHSKEQDDEQPQHPHQHPHQHEQHSHSHSHSRAHSHEHDGSASNGAAQRRASVQSSSSSDSQSGDSSGESDEEEEEEDTPREDMPRSSHTVVPPFQ